MDNLRGLLCASADEENTELLASPTRSDVRISNGALEDLGEKSQGLVTRFMSMGVIQGFEFIQISKRNRIGTAAGGQLVYLLLKRAAILEPGQRIGVGMHMRSGKRSYGADPRARL